MIGNWGISFKMMTYFINPLTEESPYSQEFTLKINFQQYVKKYLFTKFFIMALFIIAKYWKTTYMLVNIQETIAVNCGLPTQWSITMLFKKSEKDLCELTWGGFQDISISFLAKKEHIQYANICEGGNERIEQKKQEVVE